MSDFKTGIYKLNGRKAYFGIIDLDANKTTIIRILREEKRYNVGNLFVRINCPLSELDDCKLLESRVIKLEDADSGWTYLGKKEELKNAIRSFELGRSYETSF